MNGDLDIHIHFSHEQWLKNPQTCCRWQIQAHGSPSPNVLDRDTALKAAVIAEDFVRALMEQPMFPKGRSRYDLAKEPT